MVNLTTEMAQLWASLGAPQPGQGRVIQFVAATKGEGTSTVAREFARYAAGRGTRPVWLVDLDLKAEGQHAFIRSEPSHYGQLGKPRGATPDGSVFFSVQPPARDKTGKRIPDAYYLSGQPAGRSRLWVSRFRREMLRPGPARPPASCPMATTGPPCAATPRRWSWTVPRPIAPPTR